MASLDASIKKREDSLISGLQSKQEGINDRTGKGNATENYIERELLRPSLPPGFECCKGSVVEHTQPDRQSKAIDRVIFDKNLSMPLLYEEDHSIFPIEAVVGLVEITMRFNRQKLWDDISHMAGVKAMRTRRHRVRVPGSTVKSKLEDFPSLSPRSFIVGLPENPDWPAESIAKDLREFQMEIGGSTHIHGLYVLGIGFFSTEAIEKQQPPYRIAAWKGNDRLFRFTTALRDSLSVWQSLPGIPELSDYVTGIGEILAE